MIQTEKTALQRLPQPDAISEDPLAEALHLLRLTGTLYCRSELSAPWGIDIPAFDGMMSFIVVMSGEAWLDLNGVEPERLTTGSLALLPHGLAHRVLSAPDTASVPLDDLPVEPISERYEVLHHGGGGALSHVMYGVMRLDHVAAQRLIAHLPKILHVDAAADDPDGWLHTSMQFIAREARNMKPGGETVITRLADILVIQVLRSWLDGAGTAQAGWLAALRDHSIGRALAAFHRAPERDWSVASLASVAGMSRSAFSARFAALVGEPVMQHVTQWRMRLARQALKDTKDSLAIIASRVGYQSEAAFCRTYRRSFGETPGALRSRQSHLA